LHDSLIFSTISIRCKAYCSPNVTPNNIQNKFDGYLRNS